MSSQSSRFVSTSHRAAPSARLTALLARCREHYTRAGAVRELLVLNMLLTFGGGIFFFWFHATVRGERGPQIAAWQHWLLDSAIGFVALLAPLAVLLAVTAATAGPRERTPLTRALLVGAGFAVITTPGPFAHKLIAGEGSWLADRVTSAVGADVTAAAALPADPAPPVQTSMLFQLLLGLPVYAALTVTGAIATGQWRTAKPTSTRDDITTAEPSRLLGILADPLRLSVLERLAVSDCTALELTTAVDEAQRPALADTLACLRWCGLIAGDPRGSTGVIYRVADVHVVQLITFAKVLTATHADEIASCRRLAAQPA